LREQPAKEGSPLARAAGKKREARLRELPRLGWGR